LLSVLKASLYKSHVVLVIVTKLEKSKIVKRMEFNLPMFVAAKSTQRMVKPVAVAIIVVDVDY